MIVADIGNPLFQGVIRGAEAACDVAGYTMVLINGLESAAHERQTA